MRIVVFIRAPGFTSRRDRKVIKIEHEKPSGRERKSAVGHPERLSQILNETRVSSTFRMRAVALLDFDALQKGVVRVVRPAAGRKVTSTFFRVEPGERLDKDTAFPRCSAVLTNLWPTIPP